MKLKHIAFALVAAVAIWGGVHLAGIIAALALGSKHMPRP